MEIIRILIGLVHAVLKAAVEGLLAIAALGVVWGLGIAAVVAVLVVSAVGFGGWRGVRKGRGGDAK